MGVISAFIVGAGLACVFGVSFYSALFVGVLFALGAGIFGDKEESQDKTEVV